MINWTRTVNDLYGNPRFFCHYSELITDEERHAFTFRSKYSIALARARKIGGRKFNNKQYEGCIVFVSRDLDETERAINEALK